MRAFIESVDKTAPFFKHAFWNEEREYRAAILRHVALPNTDGIVTLSGGDEYIDLPITGENIEYIILGPCFSSNETEQLMNNENCKIKFETLQQNFSRGTGVITMR